MLVIMTFAALDGPRLVTVIEIGRASCRGRESGEAFKELPRSEIGTTVMVTLALLLMGFRSRVGEVTEAVFVNMPSSFARARIVRMAEELVLIVPRLQVITEPVWETEAPAGG